MLALADWERPLVERAQTGLLGPRSSIWFSRSPRLAQAYRACERVIRRHSRSFYWASRLLPAPKRSAVRALYAFCRLADDAVDARSGKPAEALARWKQTALADHPPEDEPVALAWADTRSRYRIPIRYAEQLLETIQRDLHQKRYATFAELAEYCYGVASTVGLMSMHIIGFSGPEAIPYAVRLGVALQLTNILRDVGEDWVKGRVYLPLQELQQFGLDEGDIAAGRVDARWRAFMRFQLARVRRLYAQAMPGILELNPDGRLAIAAAAELYQGILDDIEAHRYDVFHRRAHLSPAGMAVRLLRAWWRLRTGFYAHPPDGPSTPPGHFP